VTMLPSHDGDGAAEVTFFYEIPERRPLTRIMCHPGFEPWAGALLTNGLCHCAVSPDRGDLVVVQCRG
jgi:hypothetical protein